MSDTDTPQSEDQSSDEAIKTDEELWAELDADPASAEEGDDDQQLEDDADEADDDADDADDTDEADGQTDDLQDQDDAAAKQGDDDADDGSDDLDPVALKEQNERLDKQFRSEQSRSIGQQRRADRLSKRVEELEAQVQELKAKGDDAPSDEEPDDLKKLREDYPDVAGPLLDKLEDLQEQLQAGKPDVQSELDRAQAELKDIEEEEMAKLRSEHSDGFQVISDNSQDFLLWMNDQPAKYREIFLRNERHLTDGVGAALLITRFKDHLASSQQSDEVDEQSETTDKLTTKRQKQLAGARTKKAKARTTQIVPDDPRGSDDAQSEWDYWDRQDAKKQRA